MQPLQCDSRLSDAKHNSITLAAAAARDLDTAIPLRSADTELRNAIELRTTAPQIAAILQLQNRISKADAKMKQLLPKHFRNLHAAITMRFTTLRCKTQ